VILLRSSIGPTTAKNHPTATGVQTRIRKLNINASPSIANNGYLNHDNKIKFTANATTCTRTTITTTTATATTTATKTGAATIVAA
jgi:hypothetical protein